MFLILLKSEFYVLNQFRCFFFADHPKPGPESWQCRKRAGNWRRSGNCFAVDLFVLSLTHLFYFILSTLNPARARHRPPLFFLFPLTRHRVWMDISGSVLFGGRELFAPCFLRFEWTERGRGQTLTLHTPSQQFSLISPCRCDTARRITPASSKLEICSVNYSDLRFRWYSWGIIVLMILFIFIKFYEKSIP